MHGGREVGDASLEGSVGWRQRFRAPEKIADLGGDLLPDGCDDVGVPLGHGGVGPAHDAHDRWLADAEEQQQLWERRGAGWLFPFFDCPMCGKPLCMGQGTGYGGADLLSC